MTFDCPACGHTHLSLGSFCDRCGGAMEPGVCTLRHPQSARFHALLDELGRTHDVKQRDYGRVGRPFANCEASTDWSVPAWVGTMIRATDKLRRLQRYAETGTLANEGVRDSFIDLAVYTLIACLLWEDR